MGKNPKNYLPRFEQQTKFQRTTIHAEFEKFPNIRIQSKDLISQLDTVFCFRLSADRAKFLINWLEKYIQIIERLKMNGEIEE